ncbi:hypothetical protein ZEAMMB73_Zm00001d018643 [Zea mays]|uniref:Uncharacterized protein n=1 Tax=Zea mays TaxID=4577 RepID=A0A1D6HR84_MAIZE|nr:hypothetical protein ZEAMMB73_Zm00001d018643 [Zea mays]
MMTEVLIGSLMIGNCSDRLCVHVSRMWEFYDPQDESNLLHVDMVLIDEEATSFLADQISIADQDSLQIIIFVGTLARSYAGTTSLTGGSSCKWYVKSQVLEATSLAARYHKHVTCFP